LDVAGPLPLSPKDRQSINKVKCHVAHNMHTRPILLAELRSINAILVRHEEEIASLPVETDRNLKLIEIIQRRSSEAFQAFIYALNICSETTAAHILLTGETCH